MKIAFFDTHSFEREQFDSLNHSFGHDITYLEPRLTDATAKLAQGHDVVCSFANDRVDEAALKTLHACGVKLVALRSAGFNHVDLKAAQALGIPVVRVPAYSPYSVAEHAMALILSLNRKVHKAYYRVREGNFSLNGLVGFDLHSKTVGIIGTGRIGAAFARICHGFGSRVLAYDILPDRVLSSELGLKYVPLEELYRESDIISLHCPLNAETRHIIDDKSLRAMKPGVMLINTGRGALIETKALIDALKKEHIGAAGLDVYEEEEGVFFQDLSSKVLQDDQLARLLTFSNVLVTSHQGFLTIDALRNIADTTLQNISDFQSKKTLVNEVKA